MSKELLDQLSKCKVACGYTIEGDKIIIPKLSPLSLIEGNLYIIKLKDAFFNNVKDSSLTTNWNNGIIPKYQYYKIDLTKVMGSMIRVNGIAFDKENNKDINDMFNGWLPLNEVEVLQKL